MTTLVKNNSNSVLTQAALHLLVWGMLFGFPFLFSSFGEEWQSAFYLRTVFPLFFNALIFYVNYFFLIDKVLFRNQIFLFILINLALIAMSLWGIEWIRDMLPGRNFGRRPPPSSLRSSFRIFGMARSAFSMALTVGVSVAFQVMRRWAKVETQRKAMETEQLKSTLSHLQYQIQPHFFFNSLNNIYSLVDRSPDKAKDSIHRLSKLMRYLLHEARAEQVPLSGEIGFLSNYIDLMRLRLTEKVEVDWEFPGDSQGMQIAPLLLIPLVENAFKHGVSASQPSFIHLRLKVEGARILFAAENTNFPKTEQDKGGSGIGLENLRRRLELLYPGRHVLRQEVEDGIFRTVLWIETNAST